jgi:hypothetical protein
MVFPTADSWAGTTFLRLRARMEIVADTEPTSAAR